MTERLKALLGSERVLENESLKEYTTFRVGGPSKALILVNNREELSKVIGLLKESGSTFFVIGNGSNLLVGDKGYDGYVVKLSGDFLEIKTEGERIRAGAGAMLVKVCKEAESKALSGLEFAYGIPGTVGGAMVMNAGAYGGEMKDCVESVDVLREDGSIVTLSKEEMAFGYRDSLLKHKDYICLETCFSLKADDKKLITERMNECMGKRRDKQPLEHPSAGSTFKRPEGAFAGKLIEEAGLRGFRVGGACVSEKHCGFVVNDKGGSAKDICDVMEEVSRRVKENSGFTLEPEVIKIGNF